MSLLYDSNFVVALSFLLFVGILVWAKVPGMITRALDARAERIRGQIEEARALREEAQVLLASYERKSREVSRLADEIVERAREEAKAAAAAGRKALERTVARRLRAAEEQIAAAEAAAVAHIRNEAAAIAVAAAAEVIAARMSEAEAARLTDEAIAETARRLN